MPKPKLTATSLLEMPLIWSTLMSRLTGVDAARDAAVVRDFCDRFQIHPRTVMAKVKAHVRPASGRLN